MIPHCYQIFAQFFVFLLVYMDDILIIGNNLHAQLNSHITFKDLETLENFLCVKVTINLG